MFEFESGCLLYEGLTVAYMKGVGLPKFQLSGEKFNEYVVRFNPPAGGGGVIIATGEQEALEWLRRAEPRWYTELLAGTCDLGQMVFQPVKLRELVDTHTLTKEQFLLLEGRGRCDCGGPESGTACAPDCAALHAYDRAADLWKEELYQRELAANPTVELWGEYEEEEDVFTLSRSVAEQLVTAGVLMKCDDEICLEYNTHHPEPQDRRMESVREAAERIQPGCTGGD